MDTSATAAYELPSHLVNFFASYYFHIYTPSTTSTREHYTVHHHLNTPSTTSTREHYTMYYLLDTSSATAAVYSSTTARDDIFDTPSPTSSIHSPTTARNHVHNAM